LPRNTAYGTKQHKLKTASTLFEFWHIEEALFGAARLRCFYALGYDNRKGGCLVLKVAGDLGVQIIC
jgi:hypothetical protein